jgi:hypothetical protein
MLKRAEPPVCVGLYARWGSGKTFMISLLKKEFDPTVREDPKTRRLLQFFEEGYEELSTEAPPEETVSSLTCGLLLAILLSLPKAIFPYIFPTMPYGVTTFFSLIWDAFGVNKALRGVSTWCSGLRRSRWKIKATSTRLELLRYQSVPRAEEKQVKETSGAEKEFIFVDFNAWECVNHAFLLNTSLWARL